ncbi:MAG: hypothetical protein MK105_02165 [Crocinitomicaceae bacterium]|nr:hypothetical protein [Crocinitomicaceae bacterium]
MRYLIVISIVLSSFNLVIGQQSLIPLHSFYKDQVFANKGQQTYNEGSFFPVSISEYNLTSLIKDSTKQYYDATHILFQKHLIDVKGKDYHLKISPAIHFGYGRDLADTITRNLFQNTRGFYVEGDLFKNFSFSTSLFENQSRNTQYESTYYKSNGEFYPLPDSTYSGQNAVIPGAGRTKPFKGDGFDYAYAIGYFVYRPFKFLRITAGNNAQFIGNGHRSLFISDNSYSFPYYRIDWKISQKFNFTYLRGRQTNLLRRPASGSVEAIYENKGYSINYLTYKITDKINISLFESGNWSKGDSITSKASHPLYYNPIPFISGAVLNKTNELSSLIGLNIGCQFAPKHLAYAQFALNNFNSDKFAFQLGYRGYNYFGLKDFMLQLEYNYVAEKTFEVGNRRLNNTHYNMPLAHVKGSGFQEIIIRSNYEWKRIYIDFSAVYYITKNHSDKGHLPVYNTQTLSSESIVNSSTEIGYRFNRMMNLMLFANWNYRQTSNSINPSSSTVNIGLRTGFMNHYKDF